MANDFDAIVIGSGFGGAVSALRLAEAGYDVLVLERGRRWKREEYPSITRRDWLWNELSPADTNGWFDIRLFGGIGTVAAAGVGGGSLHFANVVIDAHEDFFNAGWPPEINFQVLAPYYQKVSEVLHPRRIPANQLSNRTKLLKEAALLNGFAAQYDEVDLNIKFDDNYAYDSSRVPRQEDSVMTPNADGIEQGFCVHLGACVLGCPVEARNTLALNYLPRAEKKGAQIAALHLVRKIEPVANGYRVHFDKIQNGSLKPGSYTARIVVVSAGSIGSTELLLRCQKQHKTLPNLGAMLGSKWCTNANYLTPAFHDRKVYPSRGPTITAGIRFFGNNAFNNQRFMIEDGGVPDLLAEYKANMKNPTGGAKRFINPLATLVQGLDDQPFDNLMPWFSQGRDEPTGKFTVERFFFGLFGDYTLKLNWSTSAARKVLDAIQEVHRRLAEKTGGNILLQLPDQTITPHPLGGVPLGQTKDKGVVNHLGESFAYKNLYVADGSIMPGPVGHNPSKTIAALSERIVESIVKERR
ncbi:MAG TPA: GMC family oxidoreductase [Pyrinomonadaceae bacterium]|nr:GMC family oxidoreductase [Pyrinomonadaceae bacterium]